MPAMSRMRRGAVTLVGAAIACGALAACGDDGGGDTSAPPPAGTSELEFLAKDIDFPKDEVTAKAGEISVRLVNDGQIEHTWVIEDREDDLKLDTPQRGDEDEGAISLEKGTYTYYCDVAGHRSSGMEGTLTVD